MRVVTALVRAMPFVIEAPLIVVAVVAGSSLQRQSASLSHSATGCLGSRATRNDRQRWLG
jgi:hypothetical protein